MKSIKAILLLLAAMTVASCHKEELPDTPDTTRSPMSISVIDGGYTSGDKSHTRATENGYLTEFTAGDKIGLYVVKPDGSYAHENTALTLTDNGGGTLTWQAPVGTTLYYEGVTAKYFAYYPYKQTVSGTLAPTATTAAGFFAGVVSAWTPSTDQSTHTLYTASDLMVGNGSIGSKQSDGTVSLSFTMTHAMALVVIELPKTKYKLTDKDNNPLPDYYLPAPGSKFYGFMPYSTSVGTYRYLVKPSQSGAADLTGSYTGSNGNTKEYTLPQNNIAAANYAYYKVDGGSTAIIEKSYTLQTGDFYMKDGSLVGKDVELTAEQKAACLGIVYWVGNTASEQDLLLKQEHPTCTHGLVVALNDAIEATIHWSNTPTLVNSWLATQGDKFKITSLGNPGKMAGYANTMVFRAYNEIYSDNSKILAIDAIDTYENLNPAPAHSSGWYCPSAQELLCLYRGQGYSSGAEGMKLVQGIFQKNGGTVMKSDIYWSSDEESQNKEYAFSFWDENIVSWHTDGKAGDPRRLRLTLAF